MESKLERAAPGGRLKKAVQPPAGLETSVDLSTLDEIAKADRNLTIPRCVERVNHEKAIATLKTSLADACAAGDRLKGLLRKEGLLK